MAGMVGWRPILRSQGAAVQQTMARDRTSRPLVSGKALAAQFGLAAEFAHEFVQCCFQVFRGNIIRVVSECIIDCRGIGRQIGE